MLLPNFRGRGKDLVSEIVKHEGLEAMPEKDRMAIAYKLASGNAEDIARARGDITKFFDSQARQAPDTGIVEPAEKLGQGDVVAFSGDSVLSRTKLFLFLLLFSNLLPPFSLLFGSE